VPDFERLRTLPLPGVIATVCGRNCDFEPRFFTPKRGINDDLATDAAHCVPRLKESVLHVRQISRRRGSTAKRAVNMC